MQAKGGETEGEGSKGGVEGRRARARGCGGVEESKEGTGELGIPTGVRRRSKSLPFRTKPALSYQLRKRLFRIQRFLP